MDNINDYVYKPAAAFDVETHLMAMGKLIPPLVCCAIAIKDMPTDIACVVEKDKIDEHINFILNDPDYKFVAHSGTMFDLAILAGHKPEIIPAIFAGLEAGRFEDTIIREKLLHLCTHGDLEFMNLPDGLCIPLKYNLAAMGTRYLGKDRSTDKTETDAWRKNYIELEKMPVASWPESARQYVAEDAEDCLMIREIQEAERLTIWRNIGHDPFNTQDFQCAVAFALYLMSAWGFKVDLQARNKIVGELAEELKPERMTKLLAAGILRPGTPPQPYAKGTLNADGTPKMKAATKESINKTALINYVMAWANQNNVELKLTEKDKVSTEIAFFEEHKHDNEIFAEYHHRASLQKLVTTELPRMSAEIVHPCFDVLKKTGRTSSFASEIYPSFNCQNVHPKVRGCFIPRPGHLLFSIDYSGMELGTLAQKIFNLFGTSVHKDKINANIDNHTYLGSQLAYSLDTSFHKACMEAGVSTPDEIYSAFAKCKEHTDEAVRKFFAHYRKFSKPTGLGYPGGLGPKTFIAYAKGTYGITVDLDMATKLREIWHQTYPEMKQYFRWITDSCTDLIDPDKYAYTTPFGMYRAGCEFTAAANGAALQAFSAEGAKMSVFQVIRACVDPSVGSILFGKMHPMAFIHDEILGEVPDNSEAHDLCYEAANLMIASMRLVTPDVAARCTPALMRRWDKNAEPVFDQKGRLKVWEPK